MMGDFVAIRYVETGLLSLSNRLGRLKLVSDYVIQNMS